MSPLLRNRTLKDAVASDPNHFAKTSILLTVVLAVAPTLIAYQRAFNRDLPQATQIFR